MAVCLVKILHQRALSFPNQNCEYVSCMTGGCYGWMVAGIKAECIAMSGHDNLTLIRLAFLNIFLIPELSAKSALRIETVVINLFMSRFLFLIGVMFVWRIS